MSTVKTGPNAEELIGRRTSLRSLRTAAAGCTACPLYAGGTQTVFGRGAADALLMLVGEQPGDREDIEGEPFVGPAGRILAEALGEAEIERDEVYVTNAVKHFKWRQGRGKRRLHQRPSAEEVRACRPWLDSELRAVDPRVVVCLGATAARALLGASFRVSRDRGTFVEPDFAPLATGTVHPSAILRLDDRAERELAKRELARDLGAAAKRAGSA